MATTFKLPIEGQIFRATDSIDAVYKVVNGKLQRIVERQATANTDLRLPDGTVVKAGQPVPGQYTGPSTNLQIVNPNYRGGAFSWESGAGVYQKQTGQDFNSLPVYNVGDIQSAVDKGFKLGSASTFDVNVGLNMADYVNPNKAMQEQTSTPIVGSGMITTPASNGTPITDPIMQSFVNQMVSGTSPTTGGASSVTPTSSTMTDTEREIDIEAFLSGKNLSADQQALFREIFKTVSTNDIKTFERLVSAFDAFTTYSDPYFKAQTLMATEALKSTMGSLSGDLAYQEKQKKETVDKLNAQLESIQGFGSFQDTQDYKNLLTKYDTELSDLQQNLAATGKTSSSVRTKSEDLLSGQKEGLVESGTRKFSYETGQLKAGITSADDYFKYLTDVNTQKGIAAIRKTEEQVGSSALSGTYGNLIGNIGGELPRKKVQDAMSAASSFVF